jgi:His-Xaa-Ser system protein HxsD
MTQPQIELLDTQTSTMTLSLDSGLYPREVLYAAAYVFLDRAYVLLDRNDARFLVHLRSKQALEETTLRALAGEFANELLAQALRRKVAKANQKILEEVTTLAITSAAGATVIRPFEPAGDDAVTGSPPAELAQAVDDSREFLDDPLGLAAPWDDKKNNT